jgi:hypothetical protein
MSVVRLISFLRRRPELSQQDFFDLWEQHGKMMADHAEMMGVVRYSQVRVTHHEATQAMNDGRGSGHTEPYDGVAELWLDSIERLTAPPSAEKAEFLQKLEADERKFVDHSRSYHVAGDEFTIVDG